MGKGLFVRSKNHTWWVTTFALGPKNSCLSYAADSSSAVVCMAWELGVRRSPLGYPLLDWRLQGESHPRQAGI